jgi:hypothetical protein
MNDAIAIEEPSDSIWGLIPNYPEPDTTGMSSSGNKPMYADYIDDVAAAPQTRYIVITPAQEVSFARPVLRKRSSDETSHDVASEFMSLAKQWKEDTLYSSSLEDICFHPAYQTIMAMGEKALPLILRELCRQFGHWFYALSHIVREDMAKGTKDIEEARRRWIEWGRNTGKL